MERHPLDPVSLAFGVLFTLTGLIFLARDVPLIPAIDLRWVGPVVVLGLGVWLLASVGLSRTREEDPGTRQDDDLSGNRHDEPPAPDHPGA